MTINQPYHVCVIDIGSPKLGNIGWSCLNVLNDEEVCGTDLNEMCRHLADLLSSSGVLLGLEAPLFVPLREDIMLATKGRLGEGRRPWSGGAGAQVLVINLPIMVYLFENINAALKTYQVTSCQATSCQFHLNEKNFQANPCQILLFEALVSGKDKGSSHIQDAQIMSRYCLDYSLNKTLPPSILLPEAGVRYFNLAQAALMRAELSTAVHLLAEPSPIYQPSQHTNTTC